MHIPLCIVHCASTLNVATFANELENKLSFCRDLCHSEVNSAVLKSGRGKFAGVFKCSLITRKAIIPTAPSIVEAS